jgi:hypothetical protein
MVQRRAELGQSGRAARPHEAAHERRSVAQTAADSYGYRYVLLQNYPILVEFEGAKTAAFVT